MIQGSYRPGKKLENLGIYIYIYEVREILKILSQRNLFLYIDHEWASIENNETNEQNTIGFWKKRGKKKNEVESCSRKKKVEWVNTENWSF